MLPAPAAAASPAEFERKSSSNTEISSADRGLFVAGKFANYVRFVQSLAHYLPEVASWALALRAMPIAAFMLNVKLNFHEAIAAHQRGDNQGRDSAAAAVVRQKATENGLDVNKLRADDYVKLVRYASLFVILATEGQ
jgi:hypothetical protein